MNKRIRLFARNKLTLAGLCIILLTGVTAGLAGRIAPFDPLSQNLWERYEPPSSKHLLGTDGYGRDILSRMLYGARVSLVVSFVATGLSALAGSLLGIVAGFRGGIVDSVIMKSVDILMSFPSLLLGLLIVSVLGPGTYKVIVAISIALLPRFIRVARAPVLSLREIEFIESAKAIGASEFRILFFHILPNVLGIIAVATSLWMSTAIRLEASLSFLGLGTQEPNPSLGLMVKTGMEGFLGAPYASLFPGLGIALLVLAFNLVGDALRDSLDPKLMS